MRERSASRLTVIDGQQRLTSALLLLAAAQTVLGLAGKGTLSPGDAAHIAEAFWLPDGSAAFAPTYFDRAPYFRGVGPSSPNKGVPVPAASQKTFFKSSKTCFLNTKIVKTCILEVLLI